MTPLDAALATMLVWYGVIEPGDPVITGEPTGGK